MNRHTEAIWQTLVQAGLVQGAEPKTGELESPWYVKVLLAFSGWLASLFFLGFIGVGFEFVFRDSWLALIIGSLMIAGAFVLLRLPKNEFVEHAALAGSLAGQALVVIAIFDMTIGMETMTWVFVLLLEVPLALFMPNYIHRVFSTFAVVYAFSMALTQLGEPFVVVSAVMLVAAWCWLHEFRYPQQMRKIQAIGYGLVLALVLPTGTEWLGGGVIDWDTYQKLEEAWVQPWVGEVLTGAVALFVLWQVLQRSGQQISSRLSISTVLGTVLLSAVSMKVQGLTVGMVIIVLGFAASNRILLGLGIMALLLYISTYLLPA